MAAGGKALYEDNCLICHGPEGGGNVGLAPPLEGNKFVL
jgi:mono/diheme cytochrome c family protein